MKLCPKCGTQHEKTGIYCSRACANSRGKRTDEFKEAVRAKLIGKVQTVERKLKTSGEKNGSWKGGVTKNSHICDECLVSYITPYKTSKYCSQLCYKNASRRRKSDKEVYKVDCKFTFNVYDYPEWFDLTLISEFGWYTASNRGNNQLGVQRDHRYSISDGFKNGISPDIISHPANCKLMVNFENQRKHSKSIITIEELLKDIEMWNEMYDK